MKRGETQEEINQKKGGRKFGHPPLNPSHAIRPPKRSCGERSQAPVFYLWQCLLHCPTKRAVVQRHPAKAVARSTTNSAWVIPPQVKALLVFDSLIEIEIVSSQHDEVNFSSKGVQARASHTKHFACTTALTISSPMSFDSHRCTQAHQHNMMRREKIAQFLIRHRIRFLPSCT